jgi:hypothetical protein
VQLNKTPKEDYINIYILNDDPDVIAKNFKQNCEYIGHYNSIVCDSELFERYFSFIDQISKTYDILKIDTEKRKVVPIEGQELGPVRQLIKQAMLIWILGHEIGHSILHKNIVIKSGTRLHFDLDYNEYEKEADKFVAVKLAQDLPLASNFWVNTGEFIHQEYRRIFRLKSSDPWKLREIESRDFVLNSSLTVSYNKYNVPLLLRATRVLTTLLELNPQVDSTGYYHRVSGNIASTNLSPNRHTVLLVSGGFFALSCATFFFFLLTNESRSLRN